MNKNSREFKTKVYELMNGFLTEDEVAKNKELGVENEFQKGELCEFSEKLYQAKDSIYDKLGVDDDPDVEKMLENFEKITEELCYKMFDYGWKFAKEEEEES